MYRKVNQKGFTLIELLIVIVIIGILSGVLISVIDPVRQQNRSKNASIKAGLNKSSFAINTTRAGLGRLPYNTELDIELENITRDAAGCADADELDCLFTMAGTVLPLTCAANEFYGIGTTPCQFYAVSPNPASSLFRVIAKKYKLDPGADETDEESRIYVFDSSKGFYECQADFDAVSNDGVSSFTNAMEDAVASGYCDTM